MATKLPIIADLFCGASGLGLGVRNAGFAIGASVDVDPILTSSHKLNFDDDRLMLGDVASLTGANLVERAGGRVDGIVGGPPCQGFSEIGRADPADPRRDLLKHFFRIVAEVRPRFFMMENVRGLRFSKNRPLLDAALAQVAGRYVILEPMLIDATDFGAATKRPRVFVFGYDRAYVDPFTHADFNSARRPSATVREAIADLKDSRFADEEEGFDTWRFSSGSKAHSAYAKRLRSPDGYTTGHRRTPHKPEITKRFANVSPGKFDPVGRHPRLAWEGHCPTIRAGTGSDRGSYQAVRPLHPEEPRVITVREAARLQGFPDRFRFHPTIWHSFRMIGNSVSPIVAEALLSVVRSKLEASPQMEAAE